MSRLVLGTVSTHEAESAAVAGAIILRGYCSGTISLYLENLVYIFRAWKASSTRGKGGLNLQRAGFWTFRRDTVHGGALSLVKEWSQEMGKPCYAEDSSSVSDKDSGLKTLESAP